MEGHFHGMGEFNEFPAPVNINAAVRQQNAHCDSGRSRLFDPLQLLTHLLKFSCCIDEVPVARTNQHMNGDG